MKWYNSHKSQNTFKISYFSTALKESITILQEAEKMYFSSSEISV